MKYTQFREANASRLGFGTMRLPMHADGKIDFEASKEMVDFAIANGITYFDTAYKYHAGESEIFCREALVKRHPPRKFLSCGQTSYMALPQPCRSYCQV